MVNDGKNHLEPDIVVICNSDILKVDGWHGAPEREIVLVYWFEDEKLNTIYGFHDEIESHLFPGLKVNLTEK